MSRNSLGYISVLLGYIRGIVAARGIHESFAAGSA